MHQNIQKQPLHEQNIKLFQQGIDEQYKAIEYYGELKKRMEDSEVSILVEQIQKDKMKHLKILQEIHRFYTGTTHQPLVHEPLICKENNMEEIEKSLFREGENLKFYRSIYFGSTYPPVRDRLYDILSDISQHTTCLTYLYAKIK
ncbi:MAG: ferritin-like domain-containing protein [Epulopiscium sp.]|nr:ferritin-like domain-containing protein [Candidatus Epulonipiscium sp.]